MKFGLNLTIMLGEEGLDSQVPGIEGIEFKNRQLAEILGFGKIGYLFSDPAAHKSKNRGIFDEDRAHFPLLPVNHPPAGDQPVNDEAKKDVSLVHITIQPKKRPLSRKRRHVPKPRPPSESLIYENNNLNEATRYVIRANEKPDIGYNSYSLFIYGDFVRNTQVANVFCPLLRTVPVSLEEKGKHLSRVFVRPRYIPLKGTYFSSLRFEVRHEDGNLVKFKFGKCIATLKFRTFKD
jgi:hypothetical protein